MDGMGPFFATMGETLGKLDADELRERITQYARGLDDAGRRVLLDGLGTSPPAPREGQRGKKGQGRRGGKVRPSRDPLLEDIEEFAQRARAHEFMEGWGWDPEIRDERAWGDESWAWEMEELFQRAEGLFLSGELHLAVEAYEVLFGVLLDDMDESLLPGAGGAEEMLEADLGRARACYLRAVYDTTPARERAGCLLDAMASIRWVGGGPVGIAVVADADAPPLPDFEGFMEAWAALLGEMVDGMEEAEDGEEWASGASAGWAWTLRWLRREAAFLTGGVEGLGTLARGSRGRHPEAYQAWVDGLLREGREAEALSAAMEGSGALAYPGERAILADGAALIGRRLSWGDRELDACRSAWRLSPTGRRLRRMVRAEDEFGEGWQAAVARELAAFEDDPGGATPTVEARDEERNGGGFTPAPRLLAALEVLGGRLDRAFRRLRAAAPVGWSDPDHPGPLCFPALLAAASGALARDPVGRLPSGSVLDELLEATDASMERTVWEFRDMDWKPALPGTRGHEDLPRFRDLLEDALKGNRPDPAAREEYLEEGERAARERTHTIVSKKHRKAYDRAATVVAAAAEGWILAGKEDRGHTLLAGVRKEYARYPAFTRELKSALARSPLLRS